MKCDFCGEGTFEWKVYTKCEIIGPLNIIDDTEYAFTCLICGCPILSATQLRRYKLRAVIHLLSGGSNSFIAGEAVRYAHRALDISLGELACALGVDLSLAEAWTTNSKVIDLENRSKIAVLCTLELKSLLSTEPAHFNENGGLKIIFRL
jgi:hypothetical protein